MQATRQTTANEELTLSPQLYVANHQTIQDLRNMRNFFGKLKIYHASKCEFRSVAMYRFTVLLCAKYQYWRFIKMSQPKKVSLLSHYSRAHTEIIYTFPFLNKICLNGVWNGVCTAMVLIRVLWWWRYDYECVDLRAPLHILRSVNGQTIDKQKYLVGHSNYSTTTLNYNR